MPRILVIDDQPDCSEPLARLLNLCGYETVVAHHGVDALTQFEQAPPQLVILDLMMPVMDGFDFLKAMRSDRRWSDVPVIVFSAYCDQRMTERLKALGVREVFGKGRTDFDKLIDRIDDLMGAPADRQRILLVDDDHEMLETLARFLRGCGYEVQSASSAEAAMKEADCQRFDLTLIDVGLGNQASDDLLRALLGRLKGKSLALSSQERAGLYRKMGISRTLPKPVPMENLLATIREMMAE